MTAKIITAMVASFALIACANETSPPPAPDGPAKSIKDINLQSCSAPTYCGDLGRMDCNSAADGPLYYFRKDSEEIISTCGGACMLYSDDPDHPCRTMCPPPEWTCGP